MIQRRSSFGNIFNGDNIVIIVFIVIGICILSSKSSFGVVSECEMTCKSYMGNPDDPGNTENKDGPNGFTVYNYVFKLDWAIELDGSTGCFPRIKYSGNKIRVGNKYIIARMNRKYNYNMIVKELNSQLGYKLKLLN